VSYLPPVDDDDAERSLDRFQELTEQTPCYRSKKKGYTVKFVPLIDAMLTVVLLCAT
jgi:hypothetical protein